MAEVDLKQKLIERVTEAIHQFQKAIGAPIRSISVERKFDNHCDGPVGVEFDIKIII